MTVARMDIGAAVTAAHEAALVVPAPELATFIATGKDRRTWLNGLLSCDLAPLAEGALAYGLFVTQKGRVIADAVVLLDGERILLAVPLRLRDELRKLLEDHLIMEDVELADGAFEVERVHGPRAKAVVEAMRAAGASGGELDATGLGGAVAWVPVDGASRVRAARDGALGAAGGVVGDAAAWRALRLERGVPELGVDFDESTYPQEAGLEKRAVSFNKGCYLGQEVVFMLEKRGHVKRRLVTLRVQSADAPARGAAVVDAAGESVGEVTSAAVVPGAGGPVAMAMVKRGSAQVGAALRVGGVEATVVALAG